MVGMVARREVDMPFGYGAQPGNLGGGQFAGGQHAFGSTPSMNQANLVQGPPLGEAAPANTWPGAEMQGHVSPQHQNQGITQHADGWMQQQHQAVPQSAQQSWDPGEQQKMAKLQELEQRKQVLLAQLQQRKEQLQQQQLQLQQQRPQSTCK